MHATEQYPSTNSGQNSFSPSRLVEQIDTDFPGLWARIEKAQPPGAPRPFPIVRESAARTYPPGTKHPRGYPMEYLLKAAINTEEDFRSFLGSSVNPKSVFVSYSAEALQAIAAWRTTKLHYEVDPDFWDELAATPMKGTPPSEIFQHLPARAFFISRKGGLLRDVDAELHRRDGDAVFHGFFVYVLPGVLTILPATNTTISGKMEMRLGKESVEEALDRVCREMRESSLSVIRAHPNGTDAERQQAIQDMQKRWPDEEKSIKRDWHGVLSNVLYLCTDAPDVEGKPLPVPCRTSRIGARVRFSTPVTETVVGVGIRLGSVFRKAASESRRSGGDSAGKPMPPHIRRAHWHTYWAGKKGEQRPEVKWLSPILVNAQSSEQIMETVHKVSAGY